MLGIPAYFPPNPLYQMLWKHWQFTRTKHLSTAEWYKLLLWKCCTCISVFKRKWFLVIKLLTFISQKSGEKYRIHTESPAVNAASLDFVAVLTLGDEMVPGFSLLTLGDATDSSSELSFENPARAFCTDFDPAVLRAVLGPKLCLDSGRFLFLGNWQKHKNEVWCFYSDYT